MVRSILIAGLVVAGLGAGGAMAAPKTYVAKEGANSASVQIVDAGGGVYRLTLTRAGPGSCAAKLDGEARMTKGALKLIKDQAGATCTIEVTPKGTFVEVIEDSCAEVFRAADCRFDDLPIMMAK
jgi:hypothetical protein